MSTRVRYCSIALRSASYPSPVSRRVRSFTEQNTTIIHGTFWNLSNLRTVLANLPSVVSRSHSCLYVIHAQFRIFFFSLNRLFTFFIFNARRRRLVRSVYLRNSNDRDSFTPSDFRADGHLNVTVAVTRLRNPSSEKYVQTYI